MTTFYVDPYKVSIMSLVTWCKEHFGADDFNRIRAALTKTWFYDRESHANWVFQFHQPEQATLFALRWGHVIQRTKL